MEANFSWQLLLRCCLILPFENSDSRAGRIGDHRDIAIGKILPWCDQHPAAQWLHPGNGFYDTRDTHKG